MMRVCKMRKELGPYGSMGSISEWLSLAGTSGDDLLQIFHSRQYQLLQVAYGYIQMDFEYLQG